MKSTVFDYINLFLLLCLSLLSTSLFVLAFMSQDDKVVTAFFAILFSFFAMFVSPSASNIWLDHLYQKTTKSKNMHFFGRISELESYQIQTGECLRGIVLLTLLFSVPSIITSQWVILSFCVAGICVFFAFMIINVNYFKKYLNDHTTTTQNSP